MALKTPATIAQVTKDYFQVNEWDFDVSPHLTHLVYRWQHILQNIVISVSQEK
jgi:hypothetical protein